MLPGVSKGENSYLPRLNQRRRSKNLFTKIIMTVSRERNITRQGMIYLLHPVGVIAQSADWAEKLLSSRTGHPRCPVRELAGGNLKNSANGLPLILKTLMMTNRKINTEKNDITRYTKLVW